MQLETPNYLFFVANFEDGHQIIQDESDVSSFDSSRSQFYDVLEYSKTSPLISFILGNQNVAYGVDLRDGHFEVNGVPFYPYRIDREEYTDFQPIYLRNVRHDRNLETGEIITYLGYTVGFQANKTNGESVQHVMKVA